MKLAILAPLICALFRLIFIRFYGPQYSLKQDWRKLYHCFRYGFWWGMDFNAYVFLVPLVLISLPSIFFADYFVFGDILRIIGLSLYLLVLYVAFIGKMIFYYHFRDIFNATMRLGGKADKRNLLDIFFNQHHGAWLLLSCIPFLALCVFAADALLKLPSVPYPQIENVFLAYAFNFLFVAFCVVGFYYCRFGGSLKHADKPEWDEVPEIVKADIFLGKATVDDLVAIEMVYSRPVQDLLNHNDEQSSEILRREPLFADVTSAVINRENLLARFKKRAQGARITPPKKIFFLLGESYTQAPFDPLYDNLHLSDRGKAFRADPHSFVINNFLPAGLISQPAITSLISGLFDSNLEINEREIFWHNTSLLSLPLQLKKLGYKTHLWYGGGLSWSSLGLFSQASGFDRVYGGNEICPKDTPKTWLGIYDHLFLQQTAKNIVTTDSEEFEFHFIYTTSNHGPYTIPIKKYGWDAEKIMPNVPSSLKKDKAKLADLGTYWYADQALFDFVDEIKTRYPDSLIIVTGDHSRPVLPLNHDIIKRQEETLRERFCTSFAMYHPQFTQAMFAGNTIGGHMNILPTIIESIAPAGFEYYSLAPSFFEPLERVVTPYHWLTANQMGYYQDRIAQTLTVSADEVDLIRNTARFESERDAVVELTGWLVRHPEFLLNAKEPSEL
ncbi:LTA synthase family protein [Caviibacterium pharyngocola]|nr:sulfatase-like hydrolase/transferase [Caviibacterium pharyngocola]